MKLLLRLSFLLLFFCQFQSVEASHVSGVDLSYRHLGGDTFEFTLNVVRDCGGVGYNITTVPLVGTSTCGGTINVNLAKQTNPIFVNGQTVFSNGRGAYEYANYCSSAFLQTRCKGSSVYPGFERYIFKGTAVIQPHCDTWSFSRNIVCCRNINRNVNSSSAAVQVTLNSDSDSSNSSPVFGHHTLNPFVAAGRTVTYDPQVTDTDRDSLDFSLFCGYSSGSFPNVFYGGTSCTSPIPGITIDSKTGIIQFTPTITGNWVVVIKVDEYDPISGQHLGYAMRDFEISVQVSTNSPPIPDSTNAPIRNLTGDPALVGPNQLEACAGDSFRFELNFRDANATDSLSAISNIAQLFPNASIQSQFTGSGYDSLTAIISGQIPSGAEGKYRLFVRVKDDACPMNLDYYSQYEILVNRATSAGPDLTICAGSQSANLKAIGGSVFNWSALPGGSGLNVPSNFSCNPCSNPKASPSVTTSYVVTSNLSTNCKAKDTIVVNVVPDFTLTVSVDDSVCSIDTVQLFAGVSNPLTTYTYEWGNKSFLDNHLIANPKASGMLVNQQFPVSVTTAAGCVKKDTVMLTVAPPFPTGMQALVSDEIVCLQDTVQFSVNLGKYDFNDCGLATFPCYGNNKNVVVVDGNVKSTTTGLPSHPNPYANFYSSVRQQYLYKASDLKLAGLEQGNLMNISFYVNSHTGNPFFNNYTIKMKCTNISQLTSTWEKGLLEVYSAKTHTVSTGWNKHTFDREFHWDGNSNIVVEICYDNSMATPSRSANAVVDYSHATYAATSMGYVFNGNACSGATQPYFSSPYNALPDTRFRNCQGVNEDNFTYRWWSSGSNPGIFTSSNRIDPKANVNLLTDKTYYVEIRDTFGICVDTLSVDVDVVTQYNTKPQVSSPICVTDGFQVFTPPTPWNLLPRPNGGFWSGPGMINDSSGIFDPAFAGAGQSWVKYEMKGDVCASADSVLITVTGAPDPMFLEGPFCELDATNQLDTNALHLKGYFTSPWPGVVDSVTGNFDATSININAPDSVPVTYHAFNGCWKDTTLFIAVQSQFDATIGDYGPYCLNDDSISLFAADPGGIWTGPGVIDPRGLFSARSAGAGLHTIRVDSNGYCGNWDTVVIDVPQPTAVKILDPGPFVRSPDSSWTGPQQIFATPSGGTWNALTTPPWTPFTTQCLFIPNAIFQSFGWGVFPIEYFVLDTIAAGKVCLSHDTIEVYLCDSITQPAWITRTLNGDLKANPNGSSFNWYKNDTIMNNQPSGRILINPDPNATYRVHVGCSGSLSDTTITNAVGLEEELYSGIRVFPNPVGSTLFVESRETIEAWRLLDLRGRLLMSGGLFEGTMELNLEDLAEGQYFLQVRSHDRNAVFKFVKK